MGRNLFEEAKKQLDEDMEKIKKASENCHEEIKNYFERMSPSSYFMKPNKDYKNYQAYQRMFDMEIDLAGIRYDEATQAKELEKNAAYKIMKAYVEALKYVVGLTNDEKAFQEAVGTYRYFKNEKLAENINEYRRNNVNENNSTLDAEKAAEKEAEKDTEKDTEKEKKDISNEAIQQLNDEMKTIKEAAENCHPKIKNYIQSIFKDGNRNYELYKYTQNAFQTTYVDYLHSYDVVMTQDQLEKSKEYQAMKSYVNSLKYMVGLTNSDEDFKKQKKDGCFEDMDFADKLNVYRREGYKKNNKTLYAKMLVQMIDGLRVAKQRADDCHPQIREALQNALDPAKDEYATVLKELRECEEKYGRNALDAESQKKVDDKLRKDKGYQHALSFVQTVNYLTGQNAVEDMMLDKLGGKNVEDLKQYRQLEVLRVGMKAAERENRRKLKESLESKDNPKKQNIGKEEAKTDFSGNPVLGIKYSAVNPKNMYVEKQAELEERLARVYAAAQFRSKEIKNLIVQFGQNDEFRKEKEEMNEAYFKLYQDLAKKMSAPQEKGKEKKTEAEKEAEKEKEAEEVYKAAVEKRNAYEKREGLERIIETMEYLAGIRPNLSEETRNRMKTLPFPKLPEPDSELEKETNKVLNPWEIKKLSVKFENMDDMLENMELAVKQYMDKKDPNLKYKEMSENILEKGQVEDQAAEKYLGFYFEATANRLLDPLYQDFEDKNKSINRSDMIIVNGKTVKSILADKLGWDKVGSMSIEEEKKNTALIVAAGLQSGKRVEAFIPQENGKVSTYPVPVEMEGFQVRNLKRVKDGVLMKIIYFLSDLIGLTNRSAEREEYKDTLSSRAHIRFALKSRNLLDETKATPEYENELKDEAITTEVYKAGSEANPEGKANENSGEEMTM